MSHGGEYDKDNVRKGAKFSQLQTDMLEKAFFQCMYPGRAAKCKLASESGLTYQQVVDWFGRRRMIFKKLNPKLLNKNNSSNTRSSSKNTPNLERKKESSTIQEVKKVTIPGGEQKDPSTSGHSFNKTGERTPAVLKSAFLSIDREEGNLHASNKINGTLYLEIESSVTNKDNSSQQDVPLQGTHKDNVSPWLPVQDVGGVINHYVINLNDEIKAFTVKLREITEESLTGIELNNDSLKIIDDVLDLEEEILKRRMTDSS